MDLACFFRVAHKPSFDENGGVFHSGEDIKTGSTNASIWNGDAWAVFAVGKTTNDAPVHSRSESDIGGVLVVSSFLSKVRCFECASVVGDTFG